MVKKLDIRQWGKKGIKFAQQFDWHRLSHTALVAAVVLDLLAPVSAWLNTQESYRLSDTTQSLIGPTNPNLDAKLSYDAKAELWQFNKDGIKTPAAAGDIASKLKSQVGGGGKGDTSLYSVDLPAKPGQGITYYDNNLQLSFKMTPQFGLSDGREQNGRLVYPLSSSGQLIYTVKNNGLKEDVVLPQAQGDTLNLSYKLDLPDTLQAKIMPDGSIGIYSADPALFGNISYGSDGDQTKVMNARKSSPKTNLVFGIPAPVIKQTGNSANVSHATFSLDGTTLNLHATGLAKLQYPVTVDPSVVVNSTSEFMAGNNEGNIDFGTNEINRGALTGGSVSGGWSTSSNHFTTARYYHASAVYNGYLYVLGGQNGSTYYNDVQYAQIGSGGTISSWAPTTSFGVNGNSDKRQGLGAVAYNGYLYIMGGSNGSGTKNDVQYAKLNADGTISGSWMAANSFTTARTGLATAVYNGYLYVIGGCSNTACTTFLGDARFAQLKADGSLGSWQTTTALGANGTSDKRAYARAVTYNGFIYIIGGVNSSEYNDVQYAAINADGTIGSWMITSSFTNGRDSESAFVNNGYMYMLGGSSTSVYNDVQYAQINANGTLGSWSATASLSGNRNGQTAEAYNGYLYEMGGVTATSGGTAQTDVQIAQVDPPGTTNSFANTATNSGNALALSCSVAYNGFLYIIGGSINDSAGSNSGKVSYAPITGAGTFGTWTTKAAGATGGLPTAGRGSAGCAAYNGFLYLLGGYTGASGTSGTRDGAVYYSAIASSGAPGAWQTPGSMGSNSIRPGVFVYANSNGVYLYSVGGLFSNGTQNNGVIYAPINSDGTITNGAWTQSSNNLNLNYGSRAFAMVGKYIYAFGGYTTAGGATDSAAVEYASINSDGTTSAWTNTTSMQTAIGFTNGTSINGCIYSVGGEHLGGTSMNNVQYACPNSDGSISSGGWHNAPNLAAATTDIGVTSYNGYIYAVGGYTTAVTANIEYAAVNNGGSGSVGTWTATSSFSLGRNLQVSLAYNGYLYVIGGTNTSSTFGDVQYAPINSDGTVGTYQPTTSLPNTRSAPQAIAYKGYMYVLGGNNAGTRLNDVQMAPINTDGTLGSWNPTSSFTTARANFQAGEWNGYFYLMGGSTATSKLNDVQYAQVNTDGTLGAWQPTSSFTDARNNFQANIYNGYIYILGGNDGSPLNDVQYAKINTDGTIGSWIGGQVLDGTRYNFAATAYDGFLCVYGGVLHRGSTNTTTADTSCAPIEANGSLGVWQAGLNSLINNVQGESVVTYNGYMYATGGVNAGNTIYYATTQSAPLNLIARRGTYSTLLDLGVSATLQSFNVTGTIPNGLQAINYKEAPGGTAVFGSLTNAASLTGGGGGGGTCGGGGSGTRWVWVTMTIDDTDTAIFSDAAGSATNGNATSFTINYAANVGHPDPSLRLRGGKYFDSQILQPLDTCGP